MMPITTQTIQAKTPNSKRKNSLIPDMDEGWGSSTWSRGEAKKADEGWMWALSASESPPSGASNSYSFMEIISCWSERSPEK